MLGIGFGELIVILAVVLVVLGPKRIPELARWIGKVSREIRRAQAELSNALDETWDDQRTPGVRPIQGVVVGRGLRSGETSSTTATSTGGEVVQPPTGLNRHE